MFFLKFLELSLIRDSDVLPMTKEIDFSFFIVRHGRSGVISQS